MSRWPLCPYIENEHQCWALIFLTSTPLIHCYIDFLEPALAMLQTGPNIPYNLLQLRLQLIENVDYITEGYSPSLSQRGCQCMWHSHYFHLQLHLPVVLHIIMFMIQRHHSAILVIAAPRFCFSAVSLGEGTYALEKLFMVLLQTNS